MANVVTKWYESKTIQGAIWIFLSAVLGSLIPMIQAKEFDGWSLGLVALTSGLVALKRCFDPDIQGPLPVMNKANLIGGG